ncbi:hypothetical protein M758_8G020400 [Ceratodon purpureus]|nr:hypothetical protein M758_8G020400 [Ceratodon purpureus]
MSVSYTRINTKNKPIMRIILPWQCAIIPVWLPVVTDCHILFSISHIEQFLFNNVGELKTLLTVLSILSLIIQTRFRIDVVMIGEEESGSIPVCLLCRAFRPRLDHHVHQSLITLLCSELQNATILSQQ